MIAKLLLINYWIAITASVILGYLIRLLVESFKRGGIGMNISKFSEEIAKKEGKKVQINIAQIKEILKVSNDLLNGELYKLIRKE